MSGLHGSNGARGVTSLRLVGGATGSSTTHTSPPVAASAPSRAGYATSREADEAFASLHARAGRFQQFAASTVTEIDARAASLRDRLRSASESGADMTSAEYTKAARQLQMLELFRTIVEETAQRFTRALEGDEGSTSARERERQAAERERELRQRLADMMPYGVVAATYAATAPSNR